MTWPIGMGNALKGSYRIYDETVRLYAGRGVDAEEDLFIEGLDNPEQD